MSSVWWTLLPMLFAVFAKAKCEITAHPDLPKHLLECYRDDGIHHRANRMPSTLDSLLDLVRKVEGSPTARNLNARELAMVLLQYVKLDGIQSFRSDTKHYPSNILPFSPSGAEYFKHRVTVLGLVPKIDPSYQTAVNETLTEKEMVCSFAYKFSLKYYDVDSEVTHGDGSSLLLPPLELEMTLTGNRLKDAENASPQNKESTKAPERQTQMQAPYKCNLHFMLSYSIDPYKRDDERCSPLFEDSRKGTSAEPRSAWDPYQNVRGYYRRNRRHIDHERHFNGLEEKNEETLLSGKTSRKDSNDRMSQHSVRISESDAEAKPDFEESKKLRKRKSVSVDEREKKSQVEEIPVRQHSRPDGKPLPNEKDKFTIGEQELLSAGESRPAAGMQSLVQTGNFGRYGGRPHSKPLHSTDDGLYTGIIPSGAPLSDCPVVNGVITTPFGSLTAGTVIAGIAAGLNPEDIPPRKFGVDLQDLESPSDRVKNIWAATLAGTVADTITSSAILDSDSFQVLKGGWNDSSDPKWYLLANNQFRHLPEVALRGSLDGLLLGLNAKEWTARYSGFKLSQMLQIYYGCCWGAVGAKHRVQLRSQFVPDEVFRKQVHLMSLVMKKQKTNVLTVLNYNQISREAVGKVVQHIHIMDDNEKSYIGSFLTTKIENFVSMIAVIDSSWGHENLKKVFEELRTAAVVNTIGSNLTIVCGKDGRVLMSSENSVDFYSRFTKDMLFENCTRGMDLPLVFDALDTMYRKIFYDEKQLQKMNTNAQVAVLFPYESLPLENSYVKEKSRTFRRNFPDVRLMMASNGRSESYLDLVNNPKDLFPLVPYASDPSSKHSKEFAEGVKQSYQRISRPSCGSYFDDESPGTETAATRDVGTGNIVYYRLSPQYFYTQHGQATVTIKSKLRVPLTVCHSRKMDRPTGPSPRGGSVPDYNANRSPDYGPGFPPEARPYDRQTNGEEEGQVQCKTISSDFYRIEMNDPCEGAASLQDCDPLYISLSPPHRDTVTVTCPTCRLPTDVQYEIVVAGLTCYNSAAIKLLSPLLFSLLVMYYTLEHYF